jgi:hypothetical protein
VHVELGVRWRSIVAQVGPPIAAAAAMVAIMLPVEALWIQAADHGTATGLGLLAAESVAALAIYTGVLHAIAPGRMRELGRIVRRSLDRRRARATGPPAETLEGPMEP